MSAANKNKFSHSTANTNTENDDVSESKIIDMTNLFYLEISKKVLSEKEYEIMEKILKEKCPMRVISEKYKIGYTGIRRIYQNVLYKVKAISELLKEIDLLKEKREQLRKDYATDYKALLKNKVRKTGLENKKIIDSSFPFSTRLWNMLNRMEWETYQDLIEIPISDFPKYRGFRGRCMEEFIRFIEFENLEDEFEGFYEFKGKI